MSQENVAIAERFLDAFNRRDLDALMDTATPNIAFFAALAATIDDNSFQGREGMRAYFADVDAAWEEFRLIVDEYRDLGDRVLTLGRLEGRGRDSGAVVETPQGAVGDFRDGKLSSVRSYLDHAEALKAVGLAEEVHSGPVDRPRFHASSRSSRMMIFQ